MDFVAIDFETATARRDSACSVALVDVRENEIAGSYYTLIQPPGNRYYYYNTKIHGLRPRDTADAPEFSAIWPELEQRLAGRLVVAHNASFDMSVLAACLRMAETVPPAFSYADTVRMAQKAWPELPNHKLDTVGAFLGVDFHHHNALDDARACAAIPIEAAEKIGAADFAALLKRLGCRVQPFLERRFKAAPLGGKAHGLH